MKDDALVFERTYNAPIDRVWEALTDKGQMKQWYFDVSGFKPEVGFEFSFEGRKDATVFIHLCKVTEVVPGEKLTYSWRYKGQEGCSYVTFELFAEGDKTRLKLTHAGLETFPATPDYAKENFIGGWTHILGKSLKEFVEKPEVAA